jgi:hypothetical protein
MTQLLAVDDGLLEVQQHPKQLSAAADLEEVHPCVAAGGQEAAAAGRWTYRPVWQRRLKSKIFAESRLYCL